MDIEDKGAKMKDIDKIAKQKAEEAKIKFKAGLISYEQANKEIKPYIDLVNKKSVELAVKFKVRPLKTNVKAYLR